MSKTPAANAVDLIIDDLADRKGLGGEWSQIDAATIIDIKTSWIAAIQSAYSAALPPDTEGEAQPVAWRWKHQGAPPYRYEYGAEKPTGQSIHLFDVQPLFASPRPAVSEAVHNLLTKLWFVAGKLDPAPREDIASIIVALRAALASPPPSSPEGGL